MEWNEWLRWMISYWFEVCKVEEIFVIWQTIHRRIWEMLKWTTRDVNPQHDWFNKKNCSMRLLFARKNVKTVLTCYRSHHHYYYHHKSCLHYLTGAVFSIPNNSSLLAIPSHVGDNWKFSFPQNYFTTSLRPYRKLRCLNNITYTGCWYTHCI